MTLTKAQLTDSIHKQVDLPKIKSAQLLDSLLEIIKKTLENGEDVLISGFGKFYVKDKRKRRGRNPQNQALAPFPPGAFRRRIAWGVISTSSSSLI